MDPDPAAARIRVLVATTPGIIPDIVRTCVAAQPDLELVETEGPPPPDVVILQNGADGTRKATRLLDSHPRSTVIVISTDGSAAELFELTPTRRPLGELSPDGLIRAVRAAGRRAG